MRITIRVAKQHLKIWSLPGKWKVESSRRAERLDWIHMGKDVYAALNFIGERPQGGGIDTEFVVSTFLTNIYCPLSM